MFQEILPTWVKCLAQCSFMLRPQSLRWWPLQLWVSSSRQCSSAICSSSYFLSNGSSTVPYQSSPFTQSMSSQMAAAPYFKKTGASPLSQRQPSQFTFPLFASSCLSAQGRSVLIQLMLWNISWANPPLHSFTFALKSESSRDKKSQQRQNATVAFRVSQLQQQPQARQLCSFERNMSRPVATPYFWRLRGSASSYFAIPLGPPSIVREQIMNGPTMTPSSLIQKSSWESEHSSSALF